MPQWLTARPIAHRGLHDAGAGIVENTASAFLAAIEHDYAIECDLRISADGEAMVHHDYRLGRVAEGDAPLDTLDAAALARVPLHVSDDRMLNLSQMCELVAGRVPLVIELKSRFDRDPRLPVRAAAVLKDYSGSVAVMSFDPWQVAALRDLAPQLLRGLVAQSPDADDDEDHPDEPEPPPALRYVIQALGSGIQFLAYRVQDLPATLPSLARRMLRLPVLTWTVKTPADRERAARYADQIIFEGLRP